MTKLKIVLRIRIQLGHWSGSESEKEKEWATKNGVNLFFLNLRCETLDVPCAIDSWTFILEFKSPTVFGVNFKISVNKNLDPDSQTSL